MNGQDIGESDRTCWMELMKLMDETCQQLTQKLDFLEGENQKQENLLKVKAVAARHEKLDS